MGVVMERWCPTQQVLGVFLGGISEKATANWNCCVADDSISACPEQVPAVHWRWISTSKLPATGICTTYAMHKNRSSAVWEIHGGTRQRDSRLLEVSMKKLLLIGTAVLSVLSASNSADAATVRCGSSWDICAQRGRGPGKGNPDKPHGNQREIREGFDRK